MSRYQEYMPRILKHEGGFVDHPNDPGGATNRGVTIGTLRKLGIDKDGDGDSDIVDLKLLTADDAALVFKRFYGDAVLADLLPRGLDYAMTDFAVNSGPSRAAKHLQRILGVEQDGHLGPKTLAAIAGKSPADLIEALHKSRLAFLRALPNWRHFGGGWQRRVDEVRREALVDAASLSPKPFADTQSPQSGNKGAAAPKPTTKPVVSGETPKDQPQSLRAFIMALFGKGN